MSNQAAGMPVLIALIAALALPGRSAAQARADFSGRWTLEEPAAQAGARPNARPADVGTGWGSPLTITQDAHRLTVEYAFFTRGDMQPPLRFVYALDGTETKNRINLGRGFQDQLSRTAWDGDRLVITTTHTFPDPSGSGRQLSMNVQRTLALESPTRLVIETVHEGVLGGPPSTARAVFTKS